MAAQEPRQEESVMSHPTYRVAAAAAVLAIALAGCSDPQAMGEMKTKIDEIQAQQKDILTKLDALDKQGKDILAKAPAAAARPAAPQEDPNKVYTIPAGESFAKGPENAPVTIVEFSDFQCPFCAQAAELVKQITDAYPNDVRVIYKNYPLPFHQQAMPAAKAAIAAGKQGKFWEMHDKLFANFRTLADDQYPKYAEELGLDVEQFKKDMAAPETEKLVQDEMAHARTAEVRGTPTFFINGKKPQGRSFALYKQMIDDILKEKKG
jgi:protein-disulfide isomerase